MKSLHVNLEVSEQERQVVFRILPTYEQLHDWVLHLLLIRQKLVGVVSFEHNQHHLLLGMKSQKHRQVNYPSVARDETTAYLRLQLTDDMLDSLIRFYLTIYCGENDTLAHIDVTVDRVDSTLPYSRYTFTFGTKG